MRSLRGWFSVLLCSVTLSGVAHAQAAAEGDGHMAAGRYTLAGIAYRRAFEQTSEPRYLKLSGNAYMAMGAAGREEAIRSFRQYIQSARSLEEAQEGEALLRQAEALPQAAAAPAPTPVPVAPVPAPAPGPAPYVAPQPTPQATAQPTPGPAPMQGPAPAPGPQPAYGPAAPAAPAAGPAPVGPAGPAAAAPGPTPGAAAPEPAAAAAATGDEPRSQWFGKKGSFVIGGERLTMVSSWKTRSVQKDPSGGEDQQLTVSGTDIALLGMPSGSFGAAQDPNILRVSSVPRLAFDYFVAEHVSIGGFLGYAARSGTSEPKGGTSSDIPSASLGFIGARGGFYLPIGSALGAWFQGGLSYVSSSRTEKDTNSNGTGGSTTTEQSLSLSEVMVNLGANAVIPVSRGFAVTGGAFFDGSLTGSAKYEASGQSVSADTGELAFGLTVGLAGWL